MRGGRWARCCCCSSARRAARCRRARADPQRNADNLKAASYYLGIDAVGLCAVPEWAWYSHDAGGNPLPAYHANALNLLVDQGHETMEGASGDDWISVAQSMRAYLRFSLLGGIVAEQIRRLGYSARVHSVLDGDVLQPPLLLLSGLGEVSRIGEVILNPFLGPRLKSGSVTTDLPMAYDKPIDFGLQRFCESCNKCARECPSGAITAGPKLMYNGYEIWKSDAEKCARYRITNAGGGMCGRCMKTCPWNLEGLFAESGFRWLAMNFPGSASVLAALDDQLDRGTHQPGEEVVVGHRARPRHRPLRARQADPCARPAEGSVAEVRGTDPGRLSGRPMPPPYPVTFPVEPRGRHPPLPRAADAGAVPSASRRRPRPKAWHRPPGRRRASRRCSRCCCSAARRWPQDVARFEFVALDGGRAAALRRRRAHRRGHRAGVPSRLQPGRRPGRPQPLRAGRAATNARAAAARR